MNEKVLSLIIPLYDSQKFIRRCLDSLIVPEHLMQKMEVLVINDGSMDQGAKYAEEYQYKWPDSICVIHKSNGGHGSAVNEGVCQCKGKYFKVLDADDWVYTQNLADVIQLLEHIDVQVAACGYDKYQIQTGQVTHVHPVDMQPDNLTEFLDMQQLICQWRRYRQIFCLHGLIYRTDFYKKLPYRMPERVYYDDAFFFTVPCSHADSICIINRQVNVYRLGDKGQSVSKENRQKRVKQHEQVIQSILETGKNNRFKSGPCVEYWYRKLVSVVTDYFVTVFLRNENRKTGRRLGKHFLLELREQDIKLYWRILGKYWILLGINRMHGSETDFDRVLSVNRITQWRIPKNGR